MAASGIRNFLREDRNLSTESTFADANSPKRKLFVEILVSNSTDKNTLVLILVVE